MDKNYERILQYYLDCLKAEESQTIVVPESSGKALKIQPTDLASQLVTFFYGDAAYLDIPYSPVWQEYQQNRLTYFPKDSLYLSPKYAIKKEKNKKGLSEEVYAPLYFTELKFEQLDNQQCFRLSKLSYEPGFNYSLLPESVSMEERGLIEDEIINIETWHDKVNRFESAFDEVFFKWVCDEPIIFVSGSLGNAQSSLIYEIEWILKQHIAAIPNTALRFFLSSPVTEIIAPNKMEYIEIFPMSTIQSQVVDYALNHPFTVITGPPGTGKSQVVLNLLSNLCLNNKTVLFASKNNQAVNTVLDKLATIQQHYCPFIRVGNNNTSDIF